MQAVCLSVCLSVFSGLMQTSVPSCLDCAPMEQELTIYHHCALYILPLPYNQFSSLLHFGYFFSTWWRERMRTWASRKMSVYSQHLQTAAFQTKEWEADSSYLYLPRSELGIQHVVLLCNESALKCLLLTAMDLSNEKLDHEFNFQQ